MKRYLFLVLSLFTILLSGCGNSEPTLKSEKSSSDILQQVVTINPIGIDINKTCVTKNINPSECLNSSEMYYEKGEFIVIVEEYSTEIEGNTEKEYPFSKGGDDFQVYELYRGRYALYIRIHEYAEDIYYDSKDTILENFNSIH